MTERGGPRSSGSSGSSGPSTASTAELDAIEDALIELDPSYDRLRSDPAGTGWIPPELRRRIEAVVGGRELLREFVATELAMTRAGDLDPDPFFTRRVVDALPRAEVDHRRRTAILAVAYAGAGLVGTVIAWPWLETLASGGTVALADVDPTHAWLEALRSGGAAVAVGLGTVALALTLPFRGRQRVRSGA